MRTASISSSPSTGPLDGQVPITPSTAGVLTTASGLTFTGDSATSALALRSSDGTTLWHSGIGRVGNSPITYELDGRQYVLFGGGSVLYAFALPQ